MKTLYYPLLFFQRILFIFLAMFLPIDSETATAIAMIIVSVLILLYLIFYKPFRYDFNNYLATMSQLFLAIFYAECIIISVYSDFNFR